jgi:hypothetical protein
MRFLKHDVSGRGPRKERLWLVWLAVGGSVLVLVAVVAVLR